MPARVLIGVVTSDKAAKTRRVEINRTVRHAKYGKYIKRRSVCHVHDEFNESAAGDLVEIRESRPLSRLKRWVLVRVVEKSKEVDMAALREARRAHGNEITATLTELNSGAEETAASE
jgi:small subunit ribosomal protein S17